MKIFVVIAHFPGDQSWPVKAFPSRPLAERFAERERVDLEAKIGGRSCMTWDVSEIDLLDEIAE